MATTTVVGWPSKIVLTKETTFGTKVAIAAAGTKLILPCTSESVSFNWQAQQSRWLGMGRSLLSSAHYLTDIQPGGDINFDMAPDAYHQVFSSHFAGGVTTAVNVASGGGANGTACVYEYHTGSTSAKGNTYTMWRIGGNNNGSGLVTDVFVGGVCNQITLSGNATDPVKCSSSWMFVDGTFSQDAGAGTALTNYSVGNAGRPFVAFNGAVTVGGAVIGSVKSWTITSNNNIQGQQLIDGNRGYADFIYMINETSGNIVADWDTSETAKSALFGETIATIIVTYQGTNSAATNGGTAKLTITCYAKFLGADTPIGDANSLVEQNISFIGVNSGQGYCLSVLGTSFGSYYNAM